MPRRDCKASREDGGACRQAAVNDCDYCFWHDPEHAEDAREARRLGGARRRKEATLSGAFDLDGLDTTKGVLRLLEVAANDALQLENSIQRVRAIAYVAYLLDRVQHTSVLAERVRILEELLPRRRRARQ